MSFAPMPVATPAASHVPPDSIGLAGVRRRWRAPLLGVAGAAIAAGPLAWMMGRAWGTGYVFQGGDAAVIELATRAAAHFHQLLGPYDRYGWHHPGPAYFYLLSIPYHLLGSGARAEIVGQAGLEALAAVLVVLAVARKAGWAAGLWAACSMALLAWDVGFSTLRYVWNPVAVIVPMALVVVLAGLAVAGSGLALLGAALVGSVCAQTEVGTAPLVALVLAMGALGALAARLQPAWLAGWLPARPAGAGPSRLAWARLAWAGAALAVLVALWAPALVQQADGPGQGNLGRLIAFFGTRAGQPSAGSALHALAAVNAMLVVGSRALFGRARPPSAPGWWLLLPVALGLGAMALGWWRRQPLALALGVLGLAGTAASGAAFASIVGPIYGYLVAWAAAFPLGALVGVGVGVLTPGPRAGPGPAWLRRWATPALLGVGLALAGASVARVDSLQPETSLASNVAVAQAWQRLAPHLGRRHRTVLVDVTDNAGYFLGAGLVDRLVTSGRRVTVPGAWATVFGRQRVSRGHQQITVMVSPSTTPPPFLAYDLGPVPGTSLSLYLAEP